MTGQLKIVMFAHSLVSDWNHGNAHFLRGLARALIQQGHKVLCYEELGSWSLSNLVKEEGERAISAIDQFRQAYPELDIHFYRNDASFDEVVGEGLRDADLVLVHEWNDPEVVKRILGYKQAAGFKALFHDTHYRAYTSAGEILRFPLHLFDGVLAFGEAVRKIYAEGFGMQNVFTFHEAADIDAFTPQRAEKDADVLWIGNWGDSDRARELTEFLIQPAAALHDEKVVAYGVRYPPEALEQIMGAGIEYRGYLPNLQAPAVYSSSRLTLHVPRKQYANGLAGIPTIRVFEALACGATLLCAPWSDAENMFRPGEDFVVVPDGKKMLAEMQYLLVDDGARQQIAANGLETIRKRHTCQHRAEQLTGIYKELTPAD